MSYTLDDIVYKINEIKELMNHQELYDANSVTPNRVKVHQIQHLNQKLKLMENSYREHTGDIPEEIQSKIKLVQSDLRLLEATSSDDSADDHIERQEIDIEIPDDAKSNASSIIESNTDNDTENTEPKTTQRDFIYSLTIAIVFCIIFALLWSYFV